MATVKELVGSGFSKVNPAEALRQIVTAYAEFATVREQEATKRAAIVQNGEVTLHRIRAHQAVVLSFLEKSFAERAEVFSAQFQLADRALEQGDSKALAIVVSGIVEIAQTSPFAALTDLNRLRESLMDPTSDFSV